MRRVWCLIPIVLAACSGGASDSETPTSSAPTIAPTASSSTPPPDTEEAVEPAPSTSLDPTSPTLDPALDPFPPVVVPEPTHPLDGLSMAEVDAFRSAIEGDAQFDIFRARFPYVGLTPPDKAAVLGFADGDPLQRTISAVLVEDDRVYDIVVDPATSTIVSKAENPALNTAFVNAEFSEAINAALSDQRMVDGLTARGVSLGEVQCLAFSPGAPRYDDELGRRMLRVGCYANSPTDPEGFWNRPIEGLVATFDLDAGTLISVIDDEAERATPIPPGLPIGDAAGSPVGQPPAARQPPSPNIVAAGSAVSWDRWSFRWHIDRRTGLVLNTARYANDAAPDGAVDVLYEASMSDMFVPYQDPDPGWSFRTFLDAGEFGMGTLISRLVPGVDCPADATMLAAVVPDELLNNNPIDGAACAFERESSTPILRHNTGGLAANELVLRSISTIGNYDYITDIVFGVDGSIQFDIAAAGIVLQRATAAQTDAEHEASGDHDHGELIAPGLVGVNHDHYLNFRLDLDVMGTSNRLAVERLVPEDLTATGEADGGRTSIWKTETSVVDVEGLASNGDTVTPDLQRWLFQGADDGTGNRPSYRLDPMDSLANPIAAVTDPGQRRAGWVTSPLWVTPYDPTQRYAGGTSLPDGTNPDGLPAWTGAGRSVNDTDLVAWYTVGFHHVVRSEDLPNMPVHRASFRLTPENVFPATTTPYVEP